MDGVIAMTAPLRSFLPAHHATSASLQSLHFFVPDSGPRISGVPVGLLLSGEPFYFDEYEAHRAGIINGTGKLVIGKIGFGKSGHIKCDMTRKRYLRRGERRRKKLIFDYKAEYGKVAEVHGTHLTNFDHPDPKRRLKINPLDPELLTPEQQHALVSTILFSATDRRISEIEDEVLAKCLRRVLSDPGINGVPTLVRLADIMRKPHEDDAKDLGISLKEMFDDGRRMSATLRALCEGDLKGIFDGPTSPELKLTNDFTAYNFRGLPERAKPILISCVSSFLEAAWDRGDAAYEVDDIYFEEAWEYFRYLDFARMVRKGQKLHRMVGTNYNYVMHRLSDLSAAGNDGSETVKLAQGLLADTAIRVIFHVDETEIDAVQKLCGLSDNEAFQVMNFRQGTSLWKFGEYSLVVRHTLANVLEPDLIDTNQNMHRNPMTGAFEAVA